MIKVTNSKLCTGCLICEMACSLHHIREFSRSHSSIKVRKSILNPEGLRITVFHKRGEGSPVCDSCHGEDSLRCVQFCPENILEAEGSLT